MEDEDEGCGIDFIYGVRHVKIYPLTEAEMDMLMWLPWFARRRMIRRIKAECRFDEIDA